MGEFEVGDEVVWASPPSTDAATTDTDTDCGHSCQHVYHQECLVLFLASNSHRRFRKNHALKRARDIETPCPTCRRNFCTISDEDLAVAIKTRSLESSSMDENN